MADLAEFCLQPEQPFGARPDRANARPGGWMFLFRSLSGANTETGRELTLLRGLFAASVGVGWDPFAAASVVRRGTHPGYNRSEGNRCL
jgi:hypothetical protein